MNNAESESVLSPDISQEIGLFEAAFARELSSGLAHDYVQSLAAKLGGIEQGWNLFVAAGKQLHNEVGRDIYGPLICGYCEWVADHCRSLGHEGDVFFALRDAAPLKAAADILWSGSNLKPVEMYANRPLLGVEDEIAPERSTQNGAALRYLQQSGLGSGERSVLVDTGAWGTVIKALKSSMLANIPTYPLFWYSHNPYIPGFLNGLLEEAGIEEKFGEVINDSIECLFPQPSLRPLELTRDSSTVILAPSNRLSVVWGNAALDGVRDISRALPSDTSGDSLAAEVKKLYKLHVTAKETGEWTGVLPSNTPTWSQGQEFLANWDPNLLP